MSKRSFRIALIAVVSSLVVLAIITLVLVFKALHYPNDRHEGAGKQISVEIKSGMSFPSIARTLADKGVIDKPTWFRIYAMWRGATSSIKSGNYLLRDDQTPREVLDVLLAGVKDVTTDVAVPEGLNMLEVFAIVEKSGVAKADELEKLARDPEFLQKHGIAGESVEGYLFPATYNFRVPEKPQLVLERMIDKHRAEWNDVATRHARALRKLEDKLKWSDHDVLTLASIVEKEAIRKDEQPRIAQVFVNRMLDDDFKPHHRLQTDPTIRYGCEVPPVKSAACQAWDRKRLLDLQLHDKDNPYNTYEHEGLPPGPISNPGRAAMEAAAEPDGTDYFYFVAKPDGSKASAFARTYEEHKKNVERYVHGS